MILFAVETLGPINESAREFLDDLSRRIYVSSGDDREHLFLSRRISVAVQRFNAVLGLLHDGFRSDDHPDYPLQTSLYFFNFLNFSHFRFYKGFTSYKDVGF